MRPTLCLLPLSLAVAVSVAPAKVPGHTPPHKRPRHPANEFVLCRGDAVPAMPGIAPEGSKDARTSSPADIQADTADLSRSALSVFSGNVDLRRADQWLLTDQLTWRNDQNTWTAKGSVRYQDSSVRLTADTAAGDTDKDIATVDSVHYQLRNVRGNGTAAHARVEGNRETYTNSTYSTCDPAARHWEIRGQRIDVDRDKGVGTARHASLRIGDVPVFYLPYFTFPLDNERKSGFLQPGFGQSGSGGFEFVLPYYFNIAPNYDATLTAHWYGDRGLMAEGEFRYLTGNSHGQIDASWLPDDSQRHYDRGSVFAKSTTNLSPNWYIDANLQHVSDDFYFQDFSRETYGASIGLLPSTFGLYGRGRYWNAGLYVQDWEVTDPSVADLNAPFRRAPDAYFNWRQPLAEHVELGVKSEAVKFTQLVQPGATRVDLYPYIALPFEHAAWYVRPELGYRYTSWNLDQPVAPGDTTHPTRNVPIFDLDAGMFFERDTDWFGHSFVQTLEPRLYYLRVPYRNQDDIPIFDTQQFTFGYAQLFRTSDFTGADRQSDANQLTAAITTRLLDSADGREWWSVSFGQIRYFTPPRVTLPGQTFVDRSGSDYVVDTNLNLDDRWSVGGSWQYDPTGHRTDLGSLRGQYRFGQGGVINAAYRYRPGLVEQTDLSFVYPLNASWRLLGRWDYSLKDRTTLEALGGVEWQDCCMAVRVIGRNYIRNQQGEKNFALFLEIELKGLGSLGRDSSDLLERDILGYTR